MSLPSSAFAPVSGADWPKTIGCACAAAAAARTSAAAMRARSMGGDSKLARRRTLGTTTAGGGHMPIIAITREMGSLGKDVARGLGEALGLPVIYHEVIDHLAVRMRARHRLSHQSGRGTAAALPLALGRLT